MIILCLRNGRRVMMTNHASLKNDHLHRDQFSQPCVFKEHDHLHRDQFSHISIFKIVDKENDVEVTGYAHQLAFACLALPDKRDGWH